MAPAPAADDRDQTLVGVSFGDAYRAQEFFTAVTRLASAGRLTLLDAVFIAKDDQGQTTVRETVDPQPGRSALSGAIWAGLFGMILGGPVGWLAGAALGGASGAVAAHVMDLGIPDEWVDWFRQAVQPGTSTLAVLAGDLDRGALAAELERFAGAELVYANMPPDAVDRFRSALGQAPSGAESVGADPDWPAPTA